MTEDTEHVMIKVTKINFERLDKMRKELKLESMDALIDNAFGMLEGN